MPTGVYIRTEETKAKMKLAKLGNKYALNSKGCLGHRLTEEHKAKLRMASLGHKLTAEAKAKVSVANLGKKLTDETKDKMRITKLGNKNPNWKGGVYEGHDKLRTSSPQQTWTKQVKVRDNYTCQLCDRKPPEIKIDAHHIQSFAEFPDLRLDFNNGMTLCKEHHKLVHQAMLQ